MHSALEFQGEDHYFRIDTPSISKILFFSETLRNAFIQNINNLKLKQARISALVSKKLIKFGQKSRVGAFIFKCEFIYIFYI